MIGRAGQRWRVKRFALLLLFVLSTVAAVFLDYLPTAAAATTLAAPAASAVIGEHGLSRALPVDATSFSPARPSREVALTSTSLPGVVARIASYGADVRIRLLVFFLLGFVVVVPCCAIAERACRYFDLSPLYGFSIVVISLGVFAEVTFFLTMVTTLGAAAFVWLVAVAGTWATIRALRNSAIRRHVAQTDCWYPFALTALGGLSYAAILGLALPENLPISTATMEWLRLAIDNVLPQTLATNIAAHAPPEPFIPGWQSSDRPPLQAGFVLLFNALLPFGRADPTAYQAYAMLLQATIFGALFTLCRTLGAGTIRAVGIVVLAWLSGFFFANTAFVWPKLLAATFLATSMALMLAGGNSRWLRFATIGISTGLGLLSHAGVFFTAPVLFVAWFMRDGKRAFRPIAVVVVALTVMAAPWMWYQRAYDPPGDRLIKWHLAGQVPVSSEPFIPTLIHAYSTVTPEFLIQNRIHNLATLIGVDTVFRPLGGMPLQQRQFRILPYSLGMLGVPYLAALFLWRSRWPMLQVASRFAWIALGANLFWALVMYNPSSTVVHLGSYLTVALMYVAAGLVATEWLALFLLVALGQAVVFAIGWLPTFDLASGLTPGRWCDIIALLALIALAITIVRDPLRAAYRSYFLPVRSAAGEERS